MPTPWPCTTTWTPRPGFADRNRLRRRPGVRRRARSRPCCRKRFRRLAGLPDRPVTALVSPPPGDPRSPAVRAAATTGVTDARGPSTTHLVTADRWGNVVSYTLTIEQTGGSGIVVPGRGFLLNNELTDFTAAYGEADPNRIGAASGRGSMSPTSCCGAGEPLLAVGSPGGHHHHHGAPDPCQPAGPRHVAPRGGRRTAREPCATRRR